MRKARSPGDKPPMRLRIATFNVENLAARNSYGPVERPETAPALSLFDFAEPETRESVQADLDVRALPSLPRPPSLLTRRCSPSSA